MGLTLGKFHQILTDASYAIVSLDSPLSFDQEGKALYLGDTLQDDSSAGPATRAEDNELLEVLREAIRELPERERLVISLYYYEELTMKEIGRVLEVSESRVSQMHVKAIFSVRARLRDYMHSGRVAKTPHGVKEMKDVVLHFSSR